MRRKIIRRRWSIDINVRYHLARSFAVSLLIALLLTSASHAQPFPESDRQKAAEAAKKAGEKATDEAYKAVMKHTPDARKPVDPWGSLRTPPAGGNK